MVLLSHQSVLLALLLLITGVEATRKCSDDSVTYTPKDHPGPCAKCAKGEFVKEDCMPGDIQSTVCGPCPSGQYQNCLSSSNKCYDCRQSCEKNQMVKTNCSKEQDLVCDCRVDHARSMQVEELVCQPCLKPKVVQNSSTNPGEQSCSLCPAESYYFKNGSQPATCRKCTQCDVVDAPCTEDQDAACKNPEPEEPDNSYLLKILLPVIVIIIILIIVVYCVIKHRRKNKDVEQPLGDICNGSVSPPEDMSDGSSVPEIRDRDDLQQKTFQWLSRNLGNEWRMFMRELQGENDFKARIDVIIQQSASNHPGNTTEQIMEVLMKWQRECPDAVTTENVLEPLRLVKEDVYRKSERGAPQRRPQEWVDDLKRRLQEWANGARQNQQPSASSFANPSAPPGPNPPGSLDSSDNGNPPGVGNASGNPSPSGVGNASGNPSPSGVGNASGSPSPSGVGNASGNPSLSGGSGRGAAAPPPARRTPPAEPAPEPRPPAAAPRQPGQRHRPGGGSNFGRGEDVVDGGSRLPGPATPNAINPPQRESERLAPLVRPESLGDTSYLDSDATEVKQPLL